MTVLNTQNPIRLLQITDPHLYGSATGTLLKLNTQASLQHVIDLVKKNESAVDMILATGDIAQDASEQAYLRFMQAMDELEAPCRWIPGNHDSAKLMQELSQGSDINEKLVRFNNWQVILLDTSIEGQVHGRLDEAELAFLQASLQAAEQDALIDHCLICLHHNPIPGTAGWMLDIGLQNDEQFFAIASAFNKVKSVLYGHIHQELDIDHLGIRCLCAPSTCIQFKAMVPGFELDQINPGYRLLELFTDGSIATKVSRVTDYVLEVDYNSDGY